jgi:hypothetical protein
MHHCCDTWVVAPKRLSIRQAMMALGRHGQRYLKLCEINQDKSEAEIVEMMNQTEGQGH